MVILLYNISIAQPVFYLVLYKNPQIRKSYPLVFFIVVCQYVDMFCLFCNNESTDVVNTRLTRGGARVWRRRKCNVCGKVLTTYERPNMAFLTILSPNGQETPYSRSKLFYSLCKAFKGSGGDISQVDGLMDTIEVKLIKEKKTIVTSQRLIRLILVAIKPVSLSAFMYFLASHSEINNNTELKKLIKI